MTDHSYPIFAGCDVGSLTGEAVLFQNDQIIAHEIMRVRPRPVQTATEAMHWALTKAGLEMEDVACCVSTGYGRDRIPFARWSVSEISCHGRGAHWVNPEIRTIIDIGGQDLKVIQVDKFGYMKDFVMNDKCAAGTGRFLEGMAKVMGLALEELGPIAFEAKAPASIVKTCTVLAQFDVLCLLTDGHSKADVAAGIARAMAERIAKMSKRIGIRTLAAMTGGVAKNQAVVQSLQDVLKVTFTPLDQVDPQIIGALGAALFARERWEREQSRRG
ncbi:MAG: acyl-CoA dehydratase activase [Pseudomonadota bacterium]